MKKYTVAEAIGYLIGSLLIGVALPAGLFALAWNNAIADAFNAAHFSYWTFFVVCLGIYYLRGNKSAK